MNETSNRPPHNAMSVEIRRLRIYLPLATSLALVPVTRMPADYAVMPYGKSLQPEFEFLLSTRPGLRTCAPMRLRRSPNVMRMLKNLTR